MIVPTRSLFRYIADLVVLGLLPLILALIFMAESF